MLYTTPLSDAMHCHGISYHMYAGDTQIYLTFKSSVLGDMELSCEWVEACVRDIYRWMLYNNLKMNDDKTELLILHSRYRRQPSLEFVTVGHWSVSPTPSTRNIGVVFDSTMNFEKHISEICKSAFFRIRNISQAHKILALNLLEPLLMHLSCLELIAVIPYYMAFLAT